mmetsp:Transcript_5490/g.5376  ORF Transcript_5490/g.5376 Transcript_5490/m.5376 type:complete len:82 (+) Transcript_5490:29-274(+)
MITQACHVTGKPTYEELLDHLFGKRVGYVFDLVMVLFCFGTCVTYMITLFDILSPVLIAAIRLGQPFTGETMDDGSSSDTP